MSGNVVQDVEHSLKNMMLGEEFEMNNGELAWPLGPFSRCNLRDAKTKNKVEYSDKGRKNMRWDFRKFRDFP